MLSNDLTQIILMNPVRINYDLAKWNPEEGKLKKMDVRQATHAIEEGSMSNNFFNNDVSNIWDGVPFVVRKDFRNPFWRDVMDKYIKFRLLFNKPKKNPVQFFMEIKENFGILNEAEEVSTEKMTSALNTLERSRQRFAIAEVLMAKNVQKLENSLVKAGFTQYQTEQSLVQFVKNCKKGLCLTEIEYFNRVIPEEVMLKFDKAEELKAFDNYYVLFYDSAKAVASKTYTTKEPVRMPIKDPIMFGVMRGSNKLYLIADWVDEFCDLTYKDILKEGKDFKLEETKEVKEAKKKK